MQAWVAKVTSRVILRHAPTFKRAAGASVQRAARSREVAFPTDSPARLACSASGQDQASARMRPSTGFTHLGNHRAGCAARAMCTKPSGGSKDGEVADERVEPSAAEGQAEAQQQQRSQEPVAATREGSEPTIDRYGSGFLSSSKKGGEWNEGPPISRSRPEEQAPPASKAPERPTSTAHATGAKPQDSPASTAPKADRWSSGGFLSSSKTGGEWKEGAPAGRATVTAAKQEETPAVAKESVAAAHPGKHRGEDAAPAPPEAPPTGTTGVKSGSSGGFLSSSRTGGTWVLPSNQSKNFQIKMVRGGRMVGARPPGFTLEPHRKGKAKAPWFGAMMSASFKTVVLWGTFGGVLVLVLTTLCMFSDEGFREW